MGFLGKLFGYKWELHFVKNGSEVVYALQGDNPTSSTVFVATKFNEGCSLVSPWSLRLNFNKNNKYIEVRPECFEKNGLYSDGFKQAIAAVDPDWRNAAYKQAVLIDYATKKELRIPRIEEMLAATTLEALREQSNPKEPTLWSILERVFERKR